jgi:hypothetical protein
MGKLSRKLSPRPSEAKKSFMSEANSELLLLFSKVTKILTKNCPNESSESEIQ